MNQEKSVDEKELCNLSSLEADEEEVKEGKGLKILTLNKVLIRLPLFLLQIKARNKSYKLKNEIR